MRNTGMTRPVDELGRVVIPIELRKSLNIKEKDLLEIYVEGHTIILKKSERSCILCGNTKDVRIINEKKICIKCLNDLLEYDNTKEKEVQNDVVRRVV